MAYRKRSAGRRLSSMTPRDMELAERRAFDRQSVDVMVEECRCRGRGPVCRWCPERAALTPALAEAQQSDGGEQHG